jgi:C4-dicarboxylate-specific signal transduction histidine kinase
MTQTLLHRLSSLSFRKLLVLLTLLLALPAVGLIVHVGLDQRHDALQEGVAEARKLAYSLTSEQKNLTAAAQQLVTVLGQLPQVREHNAAAVNKILASVLALNPQFANIIIADRSGPVWASALPLTKPFSLADKRSFRNAVKTGQFSSGEYIVGQISTKSTIGFSYPVLDDKGTVTAVIAVNFNFDHFNDLFKQAGLPKGTAFNIIDYNGVIIDRNLTPEGFIGKKVNGGIFMKMVSGPEEDSFIDVGQTGDRRIVSYTKLRLPNEAFPYLYVRAGIPLQATLDKAVEKQYYNMAFLSLFLVAAIVLALLIGKHCFVNRIATLQQASHRLAAGDLHTKVSDCLQGGELGDLAQTFDQMAGQLADREKEREGLIADLQDALCDVTTLSGLLPICASCKKIRDDKGYWNQLETYIVKHSGATFSYSICPECELTARDTMGGR